MQVSGKVRRNTSEWPSPARSRNVLPLLGQPAGDHAVCSSTAEQPALPRTDPQPIAATMRNTAPSADFRR